MYRISISLSLLAPILYLIVRGISYVIEPRAYLGWHGVTDFIIVLLLIVVFTPKRG